MSSCDKWSCTDCTFLNPKGADACEICGHRKDTEGRGIARSAVVPKPAAPTTGSEADEGIVQEVDPSPKAKRRRQGTAEARGGAAAQGQPGTVELICLADSPPPAEPKACPATGGRPAALLLAPVEIDASRPEDEAGSEGGMAAACRSGGGFPEPYPAISVSGRSRLSSQTSASRGSPSFNQWLLSPRAAAARGPDQWSRSGPRPAASGPCKPHDGDGTFVLVKEPAGRPAPSLGADDPDEPQVSFSGAVPVRQVARSDSGRRSGPPSSAEAPSGAAGAGGAAQGGAGMKVSGPAAPRAPAAAPTNQLLASLHAERVARTGRSTQKGVRDLSAGTPSARTDAERGEETDAARDETITIMSYNVWFREDIALSARMAAIGDLITRHAPDVICLQEVTPNIYSIFRAADWWRHYTCSLSPAEAATKPYFVMQLSKLPVRKRATRPFRNSIMGRELCMGTVEGKGGGAPLVVATAHLESPCPAPPLWNQMYSPERVQQAQESFRALTDAADVVFCGDMNWDDTGDGPPPLPPGWCDAWTVLRPGETGLTYDCKENPMLGGGRLRKRLDRAFCHLARYELASAELVGTRPIPGLTYEKAATAKGRPVTKTLPVLPSDHFGLVLKLRPRD